MSGRLSAFRAAARVRFRFRPPSGSGYEGLDTVVGSGAVDAHLDGAQSPMPRSGALGATPGPVLETPEAAPATPKRVLVVDDEKVVRELVVEILEANGFEVEWGENGTVALERIRHSPAFDLLFTDIVMPDGPDGVELADLARALCPGLRVLLSSGYSRHILMNRETAKVGTRFLPKPYRLAQMLDVVGELLATEGPV